MIKRIERIIPLGISAKQELTAIITGIVLAVLRSLFYFEAYYNNYNQLYEHYGNRKVLVTGRKMTDFYILFDRCLDGFYVVVFLLIVLIIFHYAYHYKDSKSIYTMKRLPKKSELHKRCFAVPLISIAVCIILASALLLIFYKHYMAVTPPECLTDGQLEKFIANLLNIDWVTIF